MKITKKTPCLFAAALLLVTVGCQEAKDSMAKQKQNDAFMPDDDARSYRQVVDAEKGAGARHDGMLYPYHFDGDRLIFPPRQSDGDRIGSIEWA